jgi:hypothetical protein
MNISDLPDGRPRLSVGGFDFRICFRRFHEIVVGRLLLST